MLRIKAKTNKDALAITKTMRSKGLFFTQIERMVCCGKSLTALSVVTEHSDVIEDVEDTNQNVPRCVRKL